MDERRILFAHGAGLGQDHPWMQGWAERLKAFGHVQTFDYFYMAAGRKAPDRLPRLMEAHRAALKAHRQTGRPTVLVGKSMGSRVGCHVSLEEEVDAVICFGYPLVSAKGALRDEVLLAMQTPILFIQGTRDRLCPLDQLATVRSNMAAPSTLHVVEGGDHSLNVNKMRLKEQGITQAQVDDRIAEAIADFLATVS